ncbi:hypothetical protein quinque_007349 [Culex quinquefasciatus]
MVKLRGKTFVALFRKDGLAMYDDSNLCKEVILEELMDVTNFSENTKIKPIIFHGVYDDRHVLFIAEPTPLTISDDLLRKIDPTLKIPTVRWWGETFDETIFKEAVNRNTGRLSFAFPLVDIQSRMGIPIQLNAFYEDSEEVTAGALGASWKLEENFIVVDRKGTVFEELHEYYLVRGNRRYFLNVNADFMFIMNHAIKFEGGSFKAVPLDKDELQLKKINVNIGDKYLLSKSLNETEIKLISKASNLTLYQFRTHLAQNITIRYPTYIAEQFEDNLFVIPLDVDSTTPFNLTHRTVHPASVPQLLLTKDKRGHVYGRTPRAIWSSSMHSVVSMTSISGLGQPHKTRYEYLDQAELDTNIYFLKTRVIPGGSKNFQFGYFEQRTDFVNGTNDVQVFDSKKQLFDKDYLSRLDAKSRKENDEQSQEMNDDPRTVIWDKSRRFPIVRAAPFQVEDEVVGFMGFEGYEVKGRWVFRSDSIVKDQFSATGRNYLRLEKGETISVEFAPKNFSGIFAIRTCKFVQNNDRNPSGYHEFFYHDIPLDIQSRVSQPGNIYFTTFKINSTVAYIQHHYPISKGFRHTEERKQNGAFNVQVENKQNLLVAEYVRTEDYNNLLTTYDYDSGGNLLRVLPPNHHEHHDAYDILNESNSSPWEIKLEYYNNSKLLRTRRTPDSGKMEYLYDENEQLQFQFHYDDAGKLDRIKYSLYNLEGRTREFGLLDPSLKNRLRSKESFDRGNIFMRFSYGEEDPALRNRMLYVFKQNEKLVQEEVFLFDEEENLISRDEISNGDTVANRSIQFFYENEKISTIVYPTNLTVFYSHNSRGEMTFITDNFGTKIASFTHDAQGKVTTILHEAENFTVTYSYDIAGHLLQIKSPFLEESVSHRDGGYGANPVGDGTILRTEFRALWHDKCDQSRITLKVSDFVGEKMNYELADRCFHALKKKQVIDGLGRPVMTFYPELYDDLPIRCSTRAGGRHVAKTVMSKGYPLVYGHAYKYGSHELSYDYKGERTTKIVRKKSGDLLLKLHYVRDPKGNVLIELKHEYPDPKQTDKPIVTVTSYIRGPLGLIGFYRNSEYYSVLQDHEGSTRLVVKGGQVIAAYDYLPYGQLIRRFNYDADGHVTYLYTGQEFDEETGLYNYHARLYDPDMGRFYQVDPQEQYPSPYKYAGNSPISLVDPDGEFAFTLFLICLGFFLAGAAHSNTFDVTKWDFKDPMLYLSMFGGVVGGLAAGMGAAASVSFFTSFFSGSSVAGHLATGTLSVAGALFGAAGASNEWNPAKWDWTSPKVWSGLFGGATVAINLPGAYLGILRTMAFLGKTVYKTTLPVLLIGFGYLGGSMANDWEFNPNKWSKGPKTFFALLDATTMSLITISTPMKLAKPVKSLTRLILHKKDLVLQSKSFEQINFGQDTFSRCMPIHWHGLPSVTCDGERSTFIYTPHDQVTVFNYLDGWIMLAQLAPSIFSDLKRVARLQGTTFIALFTKLGLAIYDDSKNLEEVIVDVIMDSTNMADGDGVKPIILHGVYDDRNVMFFGRDNYGEVYVEMFNSEERRINLLFMESDFSSGVFFGVYELGGELRSVGKRLEKEIILYDMIKPTSTTLKTKATIPIGSTLGSFDKAFKKDSTLYYFNDAGLYVIDLKTKKQTLYCNEFSALRGWNQKYLDTIQFVEEDTIQILTLSETDTIQKVPKPDLKSAEPTPLTISDDLLRKIDPTLKIATVRWWGETFDETIFKEAVNRNTGRLSFAFPLVDIQSRMGIPIQLNAFYEDSEEDTVGALGASWKLEENFILVDRRGTVFEELHEYYLVRGNRRARLLRDFEGSNGKVVKFSIADMKDLKIELRNGEEQWVVEDKKLRYIFGKDDAIFGDEPSQVTFKYRNYENERLVLYVDQVNPMPEGRKIDDYAGLAEEMLMPLDFDKYFFNVNDGFILIMNHAIRFDGGAFVAIPVDKTELQMKQFNIQIGQEYSLSKALNNVEIKLIATKSNITLHRFEKNQPQNITIRYPNYCLETFDGGLTVIPLNPDRITPYKLWNRSLHPASIPQLLLTTDQEGNVYGASARIARFDWSNSVVTMTTISGLGSPSRTRYQYLDPAIIDTSVYYRTTHVIPGGSSDLTFGYFEQRTDMVRGTNDVQVFDSRKQLFDKDYLSRLEAKSRKQREEQTQDMKDDPRTVIWDKRRRFPVVRAAPFKVQDENKFVESHDEGGSLHGLVEKFNPKAPSYPYQGFLYHNVPVDVQSGVSQPGSANTTTFSVNSTVPYILLHYPTSRGFRHSEERKLNGAIHVSVEDNRNQVVAEYARTEDYNNILTTYEYDELGNLLRTIPPNHHEDHDKYVAGEKLESSPWDIKMEYYGSTKLLKLRQTPDFGRMEFVYNEYDQLRYQFHYNDDGKLAKIKYYLYNIEGRTQEFGLLDPKMHGELRNDPNKPFQRGDTFILFNYGEEDPALRNRMVYVFKQNGNLTQEEVFLFDEEENLISRDIISNGEMVKNRSIQFYHENEKISAIHYPTNMTLLRNHNSRGEITSITDHFGTKIASFTHDPQGKVASIVHEKENFTVTYSYDTAGHLLKITSPFLEEVISHQDGGYGAEPVGDGTILRTEFHALWHDKADRSQIALKPSDFVSEKMNYEMAAQCYQALKKKKLIDTLGRPVRTFYPELHIDLPVKCSTGVEGNNVAEMFLTKGFPQLYGHAYKYGSHGELIEAKSYIQDERDSLTRPLNFKRFQVEFRKANVEGNATLTWENLKKHYLISKGTNALQMGQYYETAIKLSTLGMMLNSPKVLTKFKNIANHAKIIKLLAPFFATELGKSPADVHSFSIDKNGNHKLFYTGFERYEMKYKQFKNQIESIKISSHGKPTNYVIEHNSDGNVIRADHKGISRIEYDHLVQRASKIVTSTVTVELSYDYKGERTAKIVRNKSGDLLLKLHYVRDPKENVLVELKHEYPDPKQTDKPIVTVTSYIRGPLGLIGFYRNNEYYSVLQDHEGSTRLVVKGGQVIAAYDYLPYGQLIRRFNSDPDGHVTYLYTGQEFDEETGLYNYHARLYDPDLGRFYQVDPQEQYPSPYKYAGNSPISLVDPDGEFAFLLFMICLGAFLAGAAHSKTFDVTKWNFKDPMLYLSMFGGAVGGAAAAMGAAASLSFFTSFFGGSTVAGVLATGTLAVAGALFGGAGAANEWNPAKWDWTSPALYSGFFRGATFALSLPGAYLGAVKMMAMLGKTVYKTGLALLIAGFGYIGGAMANDWEFNPTKWDTGPKTLFALFDGTTIALLTASTPMKLAKPLKSLTKFITHKKDLVMRSVKVVSLKALTSQTNSVYPKAKSFEEVGFGQDTFSRCMPIYWYDLPSVACEGDRSTFIYTAYDQATVFHYLDANTNELN